MKSKVITSMVAWVFLVNGFSICAQGIKISDDLFTMPIDLYDNSESKYRFVDENGSQVDSSVYIKHRDYGELIIGQTVDNVYSIITKTGNVLWAAQFTNVTFVKFGVFIVRKDNIQGVMSEKGRLILPIKYEVIFLNDRRSFAAKELNGYWNLFGLNGKLLTINPLGNIWSNGPGNIIAFKYKEEDTKIGFMDRHGRVVIEPIYHNISKGPYTENWQVEIDGKWGFIDTNGEYLIPHKYVLIAKKRDHFVGTLIFKFNDEGVDLGTHEVFHLPKNGNVTSADDDLGKRSLENLERYFPDFLQSLFFIGIKDVVDPLTEEDITSLEMKLKVPLPPSYTRFLKCIGGFSSHNGAVKLTEYYPFFHDYKPFKELTLKQKKEVLSRGVKWPPPSQGMLCFGELFLDSKGDQVLFDINQQDEFGEYPVYYYSHKASPPAVRKIADSFVQWLNEFPNYENFKVD